ncbi:DUF421 domain-containing protein [Uliginosibacterium paludis]|uniref:YetF domain-containing protein n=1 Tax=Uliginosibacterium paludis TaxID=1615952 RepID=A0ABV2CT28_9RHOO
MSGLDLAELFAFSLHPAEIVLRGSAVYWFIFALFRFILRRDTGSIAIADVLLLVMIADAAQNAMAGEYRSISDGFLLVATLAAWNYLCDWAAYQSPWLERLLQPRPLLLVRDGVPLRANMRRELLTLEELESKMREKGVRHLSEVSRAYLESNGEISLLLKKDAQGAAGGEQGG